MTTVCSARRSYRAADDTCQAADARYREAELEIPGPEAMVRVSARAPVTFFLEKIRFLPRFSFLRFFHVFSGVGELDEE